MNATDLLNELESLGSEQTRKTYGRHGVTGPMFGVSYANLEKLRKRIKLDHELAAALWESGNHDARVLAMKIADPAQATAKQLNAWVKDCTNHVAGWAVAEFAAKTSQAEALARKWATASNEWVAAGGWSIVSAVAWLDATDEAWLEECLATIEAKIHSAKNRVRYAMNTALISIGSRNERLSKIAIAAAKRIGPVEVDHGDTDCQTPDAIPYIKKSLDHRLKKAAKAKAKAKPKAKPATKSKAGAKK